jgi:hypothetical protein
VDVFENCGLLLTLANRSYVQIVVSLQRECSWHHFLLVKDSKIIDLDLMYSPVGMVQDVLIHALLGQEGSNFLKNKDYSACLR